MQLAEAKSEQNMITAFIPRKKMEINRDSDKTEKHVFCPKHGASAQIHSCH